MEPIVRCVTRAEQARGIRSSCSFVQGNHERTLTAMHGRCGVYYTLIGSRGLTMVLVCQWGGQAVSLKSMRHLVPGLGIAAVVRSARSRQSRRRALRPFLSEHKYRREYFVSRYLSLVPALLMLFSLRPVTFQGPGIIPLGHLCRLSRMFSKSLDLAH